MNVFQILGVARSQMTDEYSENGLDRSCISKGQTEPAEKFCVENYPQTFLDRDAKKIVSWLETCIVDYYCFEQTKGKIEWEEIPSFEGLMEEPHFLLAAKFAEHFFMVNDNWGKTVEEWKDKQGGKELLFITAARYLYITFLLYQESKPQDEKGDYVMGKKGKVKPCETVIRRLNTGGRALDVLDYKIPSYSCYPPPYGSATATSDYDVGLVGPKSGELLANFNDKFAEKFKKSSEEVFDTNIYAYTLEYAMPEKFIGMLIQFVLINIKKYLFRGEGRGGREGRWSKYIKLPIKKIVFLKSSIMIFFSFERRFFWWWEGASLRNLFFGQNVFSLID